MQFEQITDFDKTCLDLAISEAEQSFAIGNYPVGAVLTFDSEVAGTGNNLGESSQNYMNHAETRLIIQHAEDMLRTAQNGGTMTLYSTLEPCLMCLGVAVMNKVQRIIYVQKDPHAGACGIHRDSLGVRYQEVWPEIVQVPYSDKPKELITQFLHRQIDAGVRVEWSQKLLELLAVTD